MSLTFKQPRSWASLVVLLAILPVFLLSASPLSVASDRQRVVLWLYIFLLCTVAWVTFIAGMRRVELLREEGVVRVTWRTVLFGSRFAVFPLKQFHSVVSYVVPSRFPATRVELIDTDWTGALLVAAFPAASVASSFWSFPRDGEGEPARKLRISVSRAAGVEDGGFLGNRWPGAQLL